MDECIKREDAIRVVKKYFTDFLGLNPDICIDGIRSLPDADVVERKRGKLEFREEFFAYGIAHFDCSICGESVLERTFFCPNCGADMRGET